ncbi:MAG: ATP-dependent Clp protease adapter ClpS [Ferrovum sp. 37-45-19]|jgi:ATP-dependent Clp protease adaptor protein ClpS|uniref:ATP-dependent Clp protease adapter ClpS n=1 Tax=Ferrovum sp. JA12 TaxID=1356299 RepID=UPI0007030870|nr:ATP-dependent Clp protease adapter ClpS [Ferrovum sp. JA12]OYV79789.1 MAG: ATP-dependent Clp protease adapter ClpS [Ferrovum sp. 21-44-67]OYV95411.1 MAG: ATP-dependent Clp protease adapter ClpS [Ferrovum sp. 37-45-19]OZB31465.1 MAG: ATP-dependent Clp protease adapter ClpS [Ferrovum sp. 34-44-207]HQT81204.1 ATP-dependent Clp protease adapter ClpS [Ferrovaceae bacterium]KRH78091.1 ATP-dependent Clp protease adapter protein ClpS [Ferrovum sp. JA12]
MVTKYQDQLLADQQKNKTKPPSLFNVVLLNDDYTPMEFVIQVLQKFFSLDMDSATRIMLKVHTEGKGICGTYPRDLAATKVKRVLDYAKQHQHPLQCVMEEIGS